MSLITHFFFDNLLFITMNLVQEKYKRRLLWKLLPCLLLILSWLLSPMCLVQFILMCLKHSWYYGTLWDNSLWSIPPALSLLLNTFPYFWRFMFLFWSNSNVFSTQVPFLSCSLAHLLCSIVRSARKWAWSWLSYETLVCNSFISPRERIYPSRHLEAISSNKLVASIRLVSNILMIRFWVLFFTGTLASSYN